MTLLFMLSTNILEHLLNVNMKKCFTPKNSKMCNPFIVNPVMKMRPHPAAHPHYASVNSSCAQHPHPPVLPQGICPPHQ